MQVQFSKQGECFIIPSGTRVLLNGKELHLTMAGGVAPPPWRSPWSRPQQGQTLDWPMPDCLPAYLTSDPFTPTAPQTDRIDVEMFGKTGSVELEGLLGQRSLILEPGAVQPGNTVTLVWSPRSDEWRTDPLIGAEVYLDAPDLQQVCISGSALHAVPGRFVFVLPNVRPGPLALSVNPGAPGPTAHISRCRGFLDCISRQVLGAPPIEVQAVAAPPQPLSARERMAIMSSFAWGRDPEPESDASVRSDAERVCARAEREDFNRSMLGVLSSRRWMQIRYRYDIPDPDISNAARCEAARLMRLAAQRLASPCSAEVVAALHLCDDLPDAGSPSQ